LNFQVFILYIYIYYQIELSSLYLIYIYSFASVFVAKINTLDQPSGWLIDQRNNWRTPTTVHLKPKLFSLELSSKEECGPDQLQQSPIKTIRRQTILAEFRSESNRTILAFSEINILLSSLIVLFRSWSIPV